MVDFIRMGLLELWGSRVEHKLQNVRFLSTVGFEPEPSAYEANALPLSYEDWCLKSGLKFVGFYLSVIFLEIYLENVIDVAK